MLRNTSPEPRRQMPRGADVCAHVMPVLPSSVIRRGSKAGTG
jgi:hypothetical protein